MSASAASASVRRLLPPSLAPEAIAVIQLPAPNVEPLAARRALRGASRDAAPARSLLWAPPEGQSFVGVGSGWSTTAKAQELRPEADALWARLALSGERTGPAPRLFGGLAFAPGAANREPWEAFGDGAFDLPRLRYAREGERAWLDFAAPASSLRGAGLARAEAEVEAALGALAEAAARAPLETACPAITRVAELSPERWGEFCRAALESIGAGRFEKVVIARRTEFWAEGPFDPVAVIARLRASAEGCTLFAFQRGAATLLGATPERLLARSGEAVLADALAGSASPGLAGDAADDAELLASAKDRAEHAFVVRALALHFGPLCTSVTAPGIPSVRRLRHLLHLHTRVEGRLREPTHALDLARLLHPTPAVGGVPTEAALRFIAAHEPAPRGWYTGPIGWFDATGDGDFAVALRCAVIEGPRAWLWAGAGIVAASDAQAEYVETGLKQRALRGALGAPG